MLRLSKVISGGQTGADRAGLQAALDAGLPIGGHAPSGFRAEDGEIPQPFRSFMTPTFSSGYTARTRMNVLNSTATVIFTYGSVFARRNRAGSYETLKFAVEVGRPVLHLDPRESFGVTQLTSWLDECNVEILNVAGSRESRTPGIYQETYQILLSVFHHLKEQIT